MNTVREELLKKEYLAAGEERFVDGMEYADFAIKEFFENNVKFNDELEKKEKELLTAYFEKIATELEKEKNSFIYSNATLIGEEQLEINKKDYENRISQFS